MPDSGREAGGKHLHVLVLPSEEYVPPHAPLAGIFQRNHISALAGDPQLRLGVVSVCLRHSLTMYAKAFGYRLLGKRAENDLGNLDPAELLRSLLRRLRRKDDVRIDRVDGANVVRSTGIYFFPPSARTDHLSWISAGLAGYRRYIHEFGVPDLIHAHNALNAGLLASAIRRKYGVPYVLTEHSSFYYQGLVPRALFAPVREAIAAAASHSVVSPALSNSLEKRLGRLDPTSTVLPNVLPPAFESADMERRPVRTASFTILSVGNFLKVKGHCDLLQAFAKVHERDSRVRLRLVGDGPLRASLEGLANDLGLGAVVSFAGEIGPDAVLTEMLTADVLALPSLFETFGVVLIEAMACGLPIVATRCGGPESIVGPESGILVPPGDAEALAAGLLRARDTSAEFDAATIREHALARFGRRAYADRVKEIYRGALNG